MAKFILKSKINSLLKNSGKSPIVEINFLGTGGAFDLAEKNSSAIIQTAKANILIDCGSTVYSELRSKDLVEKIDYVFITHCHEDHIGSLSTFIYHKYFVQKQTVKIECIPSLKPLIENYLLNVCGHLQDSFIINPTECPEDISNGILFSDLNMIIHKIDTTNYHYKDFPSSGFIFNLRKGGENLFIVYSGDINIPITNIIEEKHKEVYGLLVSSPDNVFILHESTARDYPPFYPHCEYQKLEKTAEIFPNIFLYHHSQEETKSVIKEFRESKIKFDAISRAIDADLNKKLSLVKKYETQERLRIQAKRIKDDFKEDFVKPTLKTQDLNHIGKELIIQEEMGL